MLLLLALSPTSASFAAVVEVREQIVDDLMQRHIASRHIPGASIAVVSEGRVLFARGYGVANVELGVEADENTVYELASVTKQFTATAVMILVEEGKLSLDDRIIELIEGLPQSWETITVRHLLNHTSGIKSNTSLAGLIDQQDYGRREMLDMIAGQPLDFAPGTEWAYSNTGYYLLGALIETVSGQSYGRFLQDRIFSPLDMASTRLNDRRRIIPWRAAGYVWQEPDLYNARPVSPTQSYAAGGLVTTALDLARWEQALHARRLLTENSYDLMWEPALLADGRPKPYGLGWSLDLYGGHERMWHGGGIPGFDTYVVRFVADDLAVVVLTNLERGGSDHIAHDIAELYLPGLKAGARQPIADADPEGTAFLRDVISNAAQGRGNPDSFTAQWRAFFFPDRIKEGPKMLGTFGPLNSFDLMSDTAEQGMRLREYIAVFGTVKVRCRFKLAEDGKIAEIGISKEFDAVRP